METVSVLPRRHCERSEAIHPQAPRLLVDCFAFGSQ
jgi:hypothetical protein